MAVVNFKERDPEVAAARRRRMMATPGGDKIFREFYAAGLVEGWSGLLRYDEPRDMRGIVEVTGPHQSGYECCKKD